VSSKKTISVRIDFDVDQELRDLPISTSRVAEAAIIKFLKLPKEERMSCVIENSPGLPKEAQEIVKSAINEVEDFYKDEFIEQFIRRLEMTATYSGTTPYELMKVVNKEVLLRNIKDATMRDVVYEMEKEE